MEQDASLVLSHQNTEINKLHILWMTQRVMGLNLSVGDLDLML